MVLDAAGRNRQRTSSGSSNGKTDWIVIMEFEQGVEDGSERGFRKVSSFCGLKRHD